MSKTKRIKKNIWCKEVLNIVKIVEYLRNSCVRIDIVQKFRHQNSIEYKNS